MAHYVQEPISGTISPVLKIQPHGNLSMYNASNKKRSKESQTVGTMVESLKPSELRSVISVMVTAAVTIFVFGLWLSNTKYELDMKAHIAKDNEERAMDAEKHNALQRRIDNLADEKEMWKSKYENSQITVCEAEKETTPVPKHPPKEPVLMIAVPKSKSYLIKRHNY